LIGLLQRDPDEYLQGQANANISADEALNVDQLIIQRNEAKQSKNFAEADRIRKLLAEAGIILEDSSLGTTWRRA
jgi:cysteinyl-tRNA synthetase